MAVLFTLFFTLPVYAVGTIDRFDLVNIDGQVQVKYAKLSFKRKQGASATAITGRNSSQTAMHKPIILVIEDISEPGVTLAQPDGTTAPDGRPYVDLSEHIPGDTWDPRERLRRLRFQFHNPNGVTFTFRASLYSHMQHTPALEVTSRVLSDTDSRYPSGRTVRIDVTPPQGAEIVNGTIRITSTSTGYDSSLQEMSFGSLFYLWDTTGLQPADDYVVLVSLTDVNGQLTTDNSLVVALASNPPLINKLVSDLDISVPAQGFPVNVVRAYLLDSTFDGPMGYGWSHSYRIRVVEIPTFTADLLPVDGSVQIFNADGTGSFFQSNGDGTYQSPLGDFRTLTKAVDGSYVLWGKTGNVFRFDPAGKLTSISDRNGNTQTLHYDAKGRLTNIVDASARSTMFIYDGDSRISSIIGPAGRTVTYGYDGLRNLTQVSDHGGLTTNYAYDADHNLTTITDPAGKRTFFTTDTEDRLASVAGEGGGNGVTFAYGTPAANQMTVTDALGHQTVVTFDNNAAVTQVVDPSGNSVQMTYDVNLNLLSVTDANGGLTTFAYDARGNLLTAIDAHGAVTTLTYDATFNQVTSLTDAKGHVTTFDYDASGNLVTMTYPEGLSETFSYNSAGDLVSKTDRMNQTITLSYDSLGRLVNKSFPDNTSDTFTYDSAGNLTSATDENGTIDFVYDSSDWLVQIIYPAGEVIFYAYDAAGNRTQLVYPNGKTLDYSYDDLNRLTQIRESGELVVSYSYDTLSRVIRRDLQNGTFSTYQYDSSSRLLELINRKSISEIISSFAYTYDNAGNRLTMTTLDGTTQYIYDAINQLIGVAHPDSSTTAYNLDPAGNRVSVSDAAGVINYATNSLNQYTDIGDDVYSYDKNGNLTDKTTLADTTSYTYDFENQLIQVITPTETVNYTYDPFGRRISKITLTSMTNYIHDGFRVILETNASGNSQATYIYGIGIDEILVMQRDSIDYFYSQDELGNVTELTDFGENLVESYSYDPYGLPSNFSSIGNTYLFTGRSYEPETGLYYYRARYYDPGLGRFIQSDPIGFSGGLNHYAYVHNNPNRWNDPHGLDYWIEGPVQGEGGFGFHQSVCVGNSSRALCIAFGIKYPLPGIGPGHVYFDESNPGRIVPGFYRRSSPSVDRQIAEIFRELEGSQGIYCLIGKNCRTFARKVFDRLDQTFGDNPAGDGGDTDDDGTPDDRDDDDDNDGIPDEFDPDPLDPTNPSCDSNPTLCAGDPTFVQLPAQTTPTIPNGLFSEHIRQSPGVSAHGLTAKLEVPYENALVRANVPIFGLAYGENFKEYRVEFGVGRNPTQWFILKTSTIPQTKEITASDLNDALDATIYGNLATWDTGLKNYVYLPSHPKDHPIDLKGTYTLRLVVEGSDGNSIEDRVTVKVANVIPNAWGGTVTSQDGRFVLAVPEQALMDSFRLMLAQPIDGDGFGLPQGRQSIGKIYEITEATERFTKKVQLEIAYTEDELDGHDPGKLAIYGFNPDNEQWESLYSFRRRNRNSLYTTLRKLHSHYAIMPSDKTAEQGRLEPEGPEEKPLPHPTLNSSGGHYLVNNDFEDNLGQWSNRDGVVGATVSLDAHATFDGSKTLMITNNNYGGNFAVNVTTQSFDARQYPLIQFDYRIPRGVKTNFLVKVAGRWYEIGFTDDPKELRDKRVNIAHIGDIAGVVADDQWHTARFNLYDMLRAKTGNTLVERMIMADWDVLGYMKLTFGRNPQEATYYIDNFAISWEIAAGLRLDHDTILIDNFNPKKATNALGGSSTVFTDGKAGRLETDFSTEDISGKGHALMLSYDVSQAGSYAGYVSTLPHLDLRGYHVLTFFVKGKEGGQDLVVGLIDGAGHESKVLVGHYLPEGILTHWQQVRIPLVAFASLTDWGRIANLNLSFEHTRHGKGVVLVDTIVFQKGMESLLVDNFERGDGRNTVGRKHWTFVSGAAAINGGRAAVSGNGIYRVSYGGNIGTINAYASELKSYAGWATELGGVDCSRCNVLSFRMRGAEGGENPSIYLDDGNFRWGIEVAQYATVTTSWQQITIPLHEFADYGVDLTHLAEMQVVFEGVKMSGTIYLDDVQFGSAVHGQQPTHSLTWHSE